VRGVLADGETDNGWSLRRALRVGGAEYDTDSRNGDGQSRSRWN